jgi:hypothetical protein
MENMWLAVVFSAGMFSGVFVIFLAMRHRSETLERQHRERMAMIERGQVPPPQPVQRGTGSSSLAMSLGIVTVGLGLALMTIIGIAGETPTVGVGVGGAVVILGSAFIVRSLVVRPAEPGPRVQPFSYPSPPVPPPPPDQSL